MGVAMVALSAGLAYVARMFRWLSVALALSLLVAPAAAQPKKKPAKPTPVVEEKAPEPEPKPKPKKRPMPDPDEDDEPPKKEAPVESKSDEAWASGTRFGVGLLLGPALSTNNAEGKLTPLPFFNLNLAIDARFGGRLYFRAEPGLSMLRRTSTVRVVRKVDATEKDETGKVAPTVTVEDISNKVTSYDVSVRALLGFDYTRTLTGRVGVVVGVNSAATGAVPNEPEICSSNASTKGLVYGLHLTPLAARFPVGKMMVEGGLGVDLRSQQIPRCDVPLKGDFTVNAGEVAVFTPKIVDSALTVTVVGLQGAILF